MEVPFVFAVASCAYGFLLDISLRVFLKLPWNRKLLLVRSSKITRKVHKDRKKLIDNWNQTF